MKNNRWLKSVFFISAIATCIGLIPLAGCERKERVVDVQTPAGDVEVNRNIDSGEVEVEVEDRE